jgi:polyhydroxyalkanoate synthase
MQRFSPPTRTASRRHPVVCCHGLGANHGAFDAGPDLSLARELAARSYTVFLLDLRGHGASEHPTWRGEHRFGWAFDDYLLSDMPAAIDAACHAVGSRAVHWIGHSMGGLLLYAYLAGGGSSAIRSGVTIGSSLDYSGSASGFKRLAGLRRFAARVPAIPIGPILRAAAPFIGRTTTPLERFNIWPTNVEPAVWRKLSIEGFHWVSGPVMAQLATAMDPGGLRSRDGSIRYTDGLAAASAPVLALAGDRDEQCPPDAARVTHEALGSARRELRVFGPEHGQEDHYGHFDMLVGRRVHEEVFPHVFAWLDEHD